MDQVKVSDIALKRSAETIEQLADQVNNISLKCIQQLTMQLSELEANFREEVANFIDEVQSLNTGIQSCVKENILGIEDRSKALVEYEQRVYKQRTMG